MIVSQIAQLSRKLEHVQVDMNSLRDCFVSGDGNSVGLSAESSQSYYAQISNSAWTQATKTIAQLRADLEGIRLLVRRVEVHQSVELNVFAQLRELQRFARGLQRLVDERAPANSILDLAKRLDREVGDTQAEFTRELRQVQTDLENVRQAIMEAIPGIARQQGVEVYNELSALTSYVHAAAYDSDKLQVDDRLEKFATKITDLTVLYNKRGMKEANEYVKQFIVDRVLASHKRCFVKWCKYTLWDRERERDERAKLGAQFCFFANRVDTAVSLRCAFFDWRREAEYSTKMRFFKARMISICRYWVERVAPDMRKHLRRWRCNAVISRGELGNGVVVAASTSSSSATLSGSADATSNTEALLSDLVVLASRKIRDLPLDENPARIAVMSDALAKVVATLGGWEGSLIKMKKDQAMQIKSLKISEETQRTLLDSQVGAVSANLSKTSVTLTAQLHKANQANETLTKSTGEQFTASNNRHKRHEDRLSALEEAVRNQDRKTERIILLQGEMLERIDKLEVFQKHTISKFDKAIAESTEAKKRGQKADESNVRLKESLSDSMIFFDSEVKSLKTFVAETTNTLVEVTEKQQSADAILESSTKNLLLRADALEAQARDFFPLPPHPADLVELCLEYERHCVDSHCMGMLSTNFSPDLTRRFADFCRKLVNHLDEELEVDRFAEIVRGGGALPRQGPLGESLHLSRQRQRMVDSFVDAFAVLLREAQSSAPPGVVRANARVLFYRRFLRTVAGGATATNATAARGGQDPDEGLAKSLRSFSPPRYTNNNNNKSVSPIRATTTSRFEGGHSMGTYSAAAATDISAPPFKAPPWRGGHDFGLDGSGDDEEKETTAPTLPNTRGVLSGSRKDKDQGRPATTNDRGIRDRERLAAAAAASQRPHSSSAGQLPLPAVSSKNKFLGGGFKIPKDQTSAYVVESLVRNFQPAASIPLVHEAGPEMRGEPGRDDEYALQTRRLQASE